MVISLDIKNLTFQAIKKCRFMDSFFFGNSGCPGQLMRTTTNPRTHWTPCKPSRQVRHHGGDRRTRWDSNPCDRGKETLPLPLGHKPRCPIYGFFFFFYLRGCPGQLARTTTNPTAHWTPCKPSGHVRHHGGDRRAHEDSNPGAAGGDKPLLPPGQDLQCWLVMTCCVVLCYVIQYCALR
jgi:hypothetical protein